MLTGDPVFVFGDLGQMELDEAVAVEASLLVTTPSAAAHACTFLSPRFELALAVFASRPEREPGIGLRVHWASSVEVRRCARSLRRDRWRHGEPIQTSPGVSHHRAPAMGVLEFGGHSGPDVLPGRQKHVDVSGHGIHLSRPHTCSRMPAATSKPAAASTTASMSASSIRFIASLHCEDAGTYL